MLTISQLIQELLKYPGDMPVMVDGYEGGYCEVKPENIYPDSVIYHPQEDYYGSYQAAQPEQTAESQKALVIGRKAKGSYY